MNKKFLQLSPTFTTQEAFNLGVNAYYLDKFIKLKKLEKIRRGLYRKLPLKDEGQWSVYEVASKKVKQRNAVCLLSALEFHHLVEVILDKVWLLVDFNTRSSKDGITLLRMRNPQWKIGIIKKKTFSVTNLERTLVESLIFKNKVGPNESFYALKTALQDKKTTVSKILKMAEKLGLKNRIKSYMEPFIYG